MTCKGKDIAALLQQPAIVFATPEEAYAAYLSAKERMRAVHGASA